MKFKDITSIILYTLDNIVSHLYHNFDESTSPKCPNLMNVSIYENLEKNRISYVVTS